MKFSDLELVHVFPLTVSLLVSSNNISCCAFNALNHTPVNVVTGRRPAFARSSGGSGLQSRPITVKSRVMGPLLLMDKILHHQGWWISHYLQGFNHPRWCRILSINSINGLKYMGNLGLQTAHFLGKDQVLLFRAVVPRKKREFIVELWQQLNRAQMRFLPNSTCEECWFSQHVRDVDLYNLTRPH